LKNGARSNLTERQTKKNKRLQLVKHRWKEDASQPMAVTVVGTSQSCGDARGIEDASRYNDEMTRRRMWYRMSGRFHGTNNSSAHVGGGRRLPRISRDRSFMTNMNRDLQNGGRREGQEESWRTLPANRSCWLRKKNRKSRRGPLTYRWYFLFLVRPSVASMEDG